jgi:hypothetical protein
MRISHLRQPCSAISSGIAERYNVSTNQIAGAIAVVRNDSYKGCRHTYYRRAEQLKGEMTLRSNREQISFIHNLVFLILAAIHGGIETVE